MDCITSGSEVFKGAGDFVGLLPGDSPHVGRDHELSIREESVRGKPADVPTDAAHCCPVADGLFSAGRVEDEPCGESQKNI